MFFSQKQGKTTSALTGKNTCHLQRAARNPIARVVKLADNSENMDISRIPNPTEKDIARLHEYEAVRKILLAANMA